MDARTIRLRAGLSVLWRREGESQIGVDPRCAVVLENLTRGEQRVLDLLDSPDFAPTEADLTRLGHTVGVAPGRVRELLGLLDRSGVLDHGSRRTGSALGPEEAYWSRVLPGGDGAGLLAGRDHAVVRVCGLDHVGLRIATHLSEAGVGTLLLDDEHPVRRSDVGPYEPIDVGRPRAERARALLRASYPRLRTQAEPGRGPDLMVAVFAAVADPVRLVPVLREDLEHLPVVIGDVDIAVGPLVRPGRGPCTRCLDLHRTEADPAWPAVATQMRCAAPAAAARQLGQIGAVVAAHQALAAIDGREVAVEAATLEVGPLSPLPVLRQWTIHPECGCGGPDPVRAAGADAAAGRSRTDPHASTSEQPASRPTAPV